MKRFSKRICLIYCLMIGFLFVASSCGKATHNVTYDLNYAGAPEATVVAVISGETVSESTQQPERTKHVFAGWYTEKDTSVLNKYDFNLPVDADMTLYAGWLPEIRSVEISTEPNVFVEVGGTPSLDGGKLKVRYNTVSSIVTVNMTQDMLVDYDTSKSGSSVCTIKYGDYELTYPLCVYQAKAVPTENALYVTSDIHNNSAGLFNSMYLLAQKPEYTAVPSAVLTGGDYVRIGNNLGIDYYRDMMTYSTQTAFSSETQITYLMGNHDWEYYNKTEFENATGYANEGCQLVTDEYEIYALGYASADNVSGAMTDVFPPTYAENLDIYLEAKARENSDKIIFIQSHQPLHNGTNSGGSTRPSVNSNKIVSVLNKYADEMDIVFFWGHCHGSFESLKLKVLTAGDEMTFTGEDVSDIIVDEIKFTYANSGAMEGVSTNQTMAYVTFDAASISIAYYQLSMDFSELAQQGNAFVINR